MSRERIATVSKIDWSGYSLYALPEENILTFWYTMSRRDARSLYNDLMAKREERVAGLWELVAANSQDGADSSVRELGRLAEWLKWGMGLERSEGTETPMRWFSVGLDVGLVLGDEIIAGAPDSLKWELWAKGKRDLAYQMPVVSGFIDIHNRIYYANVVSQMMGGVNIKWNEDSDWGMNLEERVAIWVKRALDGRPTE
jgi:hypothetical protein